MIDDIRRLLDGDFGDDRILKDIYRACKNGEVISNYERKYVRDLAGRYLKDSGRKGTGRPGGAGTSSSSSSAAATGRGRYYDDDADDKHSSDSDTYLVPDVPLDTVASGVGSSGSHGGSSGSRRKKASNDGSVRLLASANKRGNPAPKKQIITIAVVAMVAVLIAGGAMSYIMMSSDDDGDMSGGNNANDENTDSDSPTAVVPIDQDTGTAPVPGEFSVRTDLSRYSIGDFVSISGWSGVSESPVSLLIANPQGVIVWSESVMAKPDGSYSTLAIAGGNAHWDEGGTFEVRAEAGDDSATGQFEIAN